MNKTFTSLFLSTSIVLSMMPAVFADEAPKAINTSHKIVISANYFTDIDEYSAKADIEYLVGRDIVNGYENAEFRPNVKLSYAEAIQLITKSFQLKASNDVSLNSIAKNKWYSDAFTIAASNQIDIANINNVNDNVTREQFAGWIIDELDRIGVYPVVRMFINISDSDSISEKYASKVQTLLLTRIASLSDNQMFRPQDAITRGEAADWLADAVKFAEQLKSQQEEDLDLLSNFSFDFNKDMTLTAEQAQVLVHRAFSSDAVEINENVDAAKAVTREQFASWVVDELNKKGNYPVKMMLIHVTDEQEMSQDASHKIQTLLLTDIATLNEAGKFRPQEEITGAEAVEWLQNAVEFMNRFK